MNKQIGIKSHNIPPGIQFSSQAKWIWSDKKAPGVWWMFRGKFGCPAGIAGARLLITAGSSHETYINGELVARGPGLSYDYSKVYDEIDVAQFIEPGEENAIAILSPEILNHGILAELVLLTTDEQRLNISSDAGWRVERHRSFKTGTPAQSSLSSEEVFDARLELAGWKTASFDDSNWSRAKVLGPVGTPPWTGLEKNSIGLLSNDEVLPKSFSAIELASLRPGYHVKLATPVVCVTAFITEISCTRDSAACLWIKSGTRLITLNGRDIEAGQEFRLKQGLNLLCCCFAPSFPGAVEMLIECQELLVFSAGNLVDKKDAEWAVFQIEQKVIDYPWHDPAYGIVGNTSLAEYAPEIIEVARLESAARFPENIRQRLKPTEKVEPSVLFKVETQRYYRVAGGHTQPDIEKYQPRFKSETNFQKPLQHEEYLLHQDVNCCTAIPQPGKDVHFIIDFGKEIIGYLQLCLDAPAGTIVDVECFEYIGGSGISWMGYLNSLRYICKDGWQTYAAYNRRGFRYVSVTLRDFRQPVKIRNICCLHSSYPVSKIGGFECSDPLLQKIFDMAQDTAALCMLDTYVDCPGHEQNFWVGDARITALINLLLFGAYALDQRSIRIVGQSLSPEWAKTYYPDDPRYRSGRYLPIAAFPSYPEGGLPIWTFMWILQCRDHYLYGGDLKDLAENYGYVSETLRHCKLLTNERGLFDMPGAWNLIEWANNDLSEYGEVTANNVFLVAACRCAAQMGRALGQAAEAAEYEQEADRIMAAVNRYCWDDKRRAYVDTVRDEWAYRRYHDFCSARKTTPQSWAIYRSCARISEQSNTLALLFDCVPEERLAAVRNIAERVRSGHYVFGAPAGRSYGPPAEKEAPGGIVAIGSPFFLFFTLGVLFKQGNHELALEVIRKSWAPMLEKGATTCWETFLANEKNWTRSVCHAWAAAPAVYLPTYVLGISPLESGYRKFSVRPLTGDLKWAKGAVATPHGPIYVSWHKNATGEVAIQYSAPPECELVAT